MCGIVGTLGRSDVTGCVVDGLSRLGYRGYESAGIALMDASGRVSIRMNVGKLGALRETLGKAPVSGLVGIGHTRWATHGPATEGNAHPHATQNVTLVHNGIIENYAELRAELEAEGVKFSSDTDTEGAAQVLEHLLPRTDSLGDAFKRMLDRIHGSYALAVIFEGHPDGIYAARHSSPLTIGYGEAFEDGATELFIGSDALALAPFTDHVTYLEDRDWTIIRSDRVLIHDGEGAEVTREIVKVPTSSSAVEKGLLDEDALEAIAHDLAGIPRVVGEAIALEPKIEEVAARIAPAKDAIFLGRGIHYPMALEAALKLKEISYIHPEGYAAGELKHGPIALIDRDLPVVVFDSAGTLQEKTLSNAAEVEARGARVWHVGQAKSADIRTPECGELMLPFIYAVVAQLLAYHAALERGTNVDQPRNLAKSVAVE